MSDDAIDRGLAQRLEKLRREGGEFVRIDRMADIVRELLDELRSRQDQRFYQEIESLADFIRDLRKDIAALRPDEIQHHYLPSAADELDAIVEATETATNSILAVAEAIESVVGDVEPAVAESLTDATTAIYEACTFQDITGQRISKVVKALKVIDERVAGLVATFGAEIDEIRRRTEAELAAKPAGPTDQDLLNGPQLNLDAGSRQSEIDALFS